jgi:hypothetical protein
MARAQQSTEQLHCALAVVAVPLTVLLEWQQLCCSARMVLSSSMLQLEQQCHWLRAMHIDTEGFNTVFR